MFFPRPSIEASATLLETECFKKYEKVGKTFYNSQVAATVRWISSSSYQQIHERLNSNPSLASTKNSQDCHSAASPLPQQQPACHEGTEPEKSREDYDNIQTSVLSESVQPEISIEKIELPPIPSFSEFAKKNAEVGERVHSNASGQARKRAMESEKQGRSYQEKARRM